MFSEQSEHKKINGEWIDTVEDAAHSHFGNSFIEKRTERKSIHITLNSITIRVGDKHDTFPSDNVQYTGRVKSGEIEIDGPTLWIE